MINKNKLFRQIHIYFSLFFLPVAVLFSVSGIAYIFGFNQDVGIKKESYIMQASITPGQEGEMLIKFLNENGLKIPNDTELKKGKGKGNHVPLTMGGAHYSVDMFHNGNNTYEVVLKTRSLLGDMIMLHKNKGAWYFSILAVGFGVILFMLYLSGLMITLFASKKDRSKQFAVLALGFLVTLTLAYLSL